MIGRDDPNFERIDAILRGAARAFGARGFAATSMREVVRETGASLGSIYYHFRNKEDILRALIAGNLRRVQESLAEKLRDVKDPRKRIELFVENHLEFFASHLDEMRVMAHELDTLEGEAGREVGRLKRSYVESAQRLVAGLRPDLSKDELQVATMSLFGSLNWTYRWFHALPEHVDAKSLARHVSKLTLDGLAPRRMRGR